VFRQGAEDGAGLRRSDLQLLRPLGAECGGGAAAFGGQPARGASVLSPPLGSEATGRAGTEWEWLRERRFADDGLAARYLDLLLKQRMSEDVVQLWASYLGRRRGDCPGFQYFVQWRFREPADRRGAGLEDCGGTRRGDGEGRSGRTKRPVVTAYFVPGSGKLELPAHGPDGVRTHGGIRLPGLRANARSDHRGGNPVPHLRCGVERAVGRL
jgi:hypothetical protein